MALWVQMCICGMCMCVSVNIHIKREKSRNTYTIISAETPYVSLKNLYSTKLHSKNNGIYDKTRDGSSVLKSYGIL